MESHIPIRMPAVRLDPRLDDHITHHIINEPRELGKCLLRITEDSAELDREA